VTVCLQAERPSNEELEQTKPAILSVCAGFAAQLRCCANVLGADEAGTAGLAGRQGLAPHRPGSAESKSSEPARRRHTVLTSCSSS